MIVSRYSILSKSKTLISKSSWFKLYQGHPDLILTNLLFPIEVNFLVQNSSMGRFGGEPGVYFSHRSTWWVVFSSWTFTALAELKYEIGVLSILRFAISSSLKINIIMVSTEQIGILKRLKEFLFVCTFKECTWTCIHWVFFNFLLFTAKSIISFSNLL